MNENRPSRLPFGLGFSLIEPFVMKCGAKDCLPLMEVAPPPKLVNDGRQNTTNGASSD